MSLRQTRTGDKPSAYLYSGMAASMALELGLHRVGTGGVNKKTSQVSPAVQNMDNPHPKLILQRQADEETRSRVYWCCYILDKALAEETGRPVLLAARRSTTPLPSTSEADEYELWPPPSTLSNRSEVRLDPTQARTISCFNATCRLGVLVERILDLDEEGPRFERSVGGGKDEDEVHQSRSTERALREKDWLAGELGKWFQELPASLRVDVQHTVNPPTHLIVNLAVSNFIYLTAVKCLMIVCG